MILPVLHSAHDSNPHRHYYIKSCTLYSLRNRGERRMSARQCVRRVYQTDGLRGFYRGMSASYAGISETVIHFVIYESIKRRILETRAATHMDQENETKRGASDFMCMMMAAATSKTCATCIAYPHGEETCLSASSVLKAGDGVPC